MRGSGFVATAFAIIVVVTLVAACGAMFRRFGARWWTIVVSALVLVFILGSFFRVG